MRRRLYFLLPDVPSAEQTMKDLLLARIDINHIHCLAKRDVQLGDELPEANFLQKTDIVHGATNGLVIGGVAGIVAGVLAVLFPPEGITLQLVTVLIAAIAGAVFGAWVAGMAGSAIPNSQLKGFQKAMDSGAILLMVDVPFSRVSEIRELVRNRHAEAISGGTEPQVPAFP